MQSTSQKTLANWRARIKLARCEHQHPLLKNLDRLKTPKTIKEIATFESKLEKSCAQVARYKTLVPKIVFPESLPISQRKDEIADLIENNQILILAGETGSGKTTQLPKICLELGYGCRGLIGHTQPRRIAARTVADRIASELKTKLGDTVGYQVRFKDVSSNNTQIKLMTDGVLLAEFQRDRFLSKYEVIIIDEAHERSLNIDFLLGLLKPLCLKRPDLKLIITSATIDLEKFAKHFYMDKKPAPVLEVSGRTFPVQTIYQAPAENDGSLSELICASVKTIIRNEAKGLYQTSGDILVFCAGEREIRSAAQALRQAQLPVEVLPLYSRLSVTEQNKVFQSTHQRKVVLATNVAETSITVPGIAYVIDPGLARISRYSFRSKIQRLPIEAISQASANQRKGRCGRVRNGVCIRLYSEEDFIAREEFTPAEILRSNLASVILKMLRLGIKHIEKFEFIDKPDSRLLNDGYKLLQELGAISNSPLKDPKSDRSNSYTLTKIGQQMSDLPIDPRYARILVSAQQSNCLRDALILVSALSIQDPRERPVDKQQAADQSHRLLQHPQSDFYSYLHLWQAINNGREELSNAAFKKHCLTQYWSVARIFEWRELYRQLSGICRDLGWKTEKWIKIKLPEQQEGNPGKAEHKKVEMFDGRYESIHRSLLSGLASNVATKDVDDQYIATRTRKVQLFPSSSQAKRKPKWLVAAEFMETSRVFMLTVAQIKPEWLIESARHLCRYSYSDPSYHARSGTVKALRKTVLYGLTLRDKESVNYGPINPREAHQIFIQSALVEARYQTQQKLPDNSFLIHNQKLVSDIEKLETKTRRRNLLVDEQIIRNFYEQRVAPAINNRASFEKWLSPEKNENLKLKSAELLLTDIDEQEVAQFPDQIEVHGKKIAIIYRFSPGKEADGVTMVVPISVLAPFPDHIGDWLVPGLLKEKCIALIRSLPKPIRRNFAPAADTVDRIMPLLDIQNKALHQQFSDCLYRQTGVLVRPDDFDLSKLDNYYRMNYRVLDTDGSLVDESRNLADLKQAYADAVQQSVHADHSPARSKFERHGLQNWNFDELPETIEYQHQGMTVRAFPMLKIVDDGSISLLIHDDQTIANYQTQRAVLALAQTTLANSTQKQSHRYLEKELFSTNGKSDKKTAGLGALATQLKSVSLTKPAALKTQWADELISAALQHCCFENQLQTVRTPNQFEKSLASGGKLWVPTAIELEAAAITAFEIRDNMLHKISGIKADSIEVDAALEDMKAQIYRLFDPTFLRFTSLAQLRQYPRYLKAVESRLEKPSIGNQQSLFKLQTQFDQRVNDLLSGTDLGLDFAYTLEPALRDFAILLEEWRVSLFAQQLRTQLPVSEKRLTKAWQALTA
ncbi:MAG: ATP-dependent helicase HrpA [Arenicella sp.]|jgi:ATP-dependent helicase HrpA